jgi:hypothetical protein
MNHNLDNDTQGEITGDGDSKALPAPQLQAHQHPALPGTHEVIRRLNRDTTWVATGSANPRAASFLVAYR